MREFGIDEVGRGPLAGPVVSCCISFIDLNCGISVDDSKNLSPSKRSEIYNQLLAVYGKYVVWGIGVSCVNEIDSLNILNATKLSMSRAFVECKKLIGEPDVVLVDGNSKMDIPFDNVIPIVKGDKTSFSIGAASIVAKVLRDRLMDQLHIEYPVFDWLKNKGYGTLNHRKSIIENGLSPHHRRSFCKNLNV